MKKLCILLLGRETNALDELRASLHHQGYQVIHSPGKENLLSLLRAHSPGVVIFETCAKESWISLRIIQEIRRAHQTLPVILLVTDSCEELAIAALRAGVTNYFRRPFLLEELLASLANHCAGTSQHQTHAPSPSTAEYCCDDERLVGMSSSMQTIKAYLMKAAIAESTVFITGETGTGKELIADLIYRNSLRSMQPFVCVNCAALPDSLLESEMFGHERGAFTGATVAQPGKFELANGGTLFLDEIGDMSCCAQAKFLRVLECKEIYRLGGKKNIPLDVRIIAATNQTPEELVSEGKFRKDLYYRLNVARIHLPPLRERKEDVPLLLDYCVQNLNRRFGRSVAGFTEEATTALMRYDWPGNVRELKNLCEAVFINLSSPRIAWLDLPEPFRRRLGETEGLPDDERERLLSALFATNWNISKAAHQLHWSRMTIYRKISKYHLQKAGGAPQLAAQTSSQSNAVTASC